MDTPEGQAEANLSEDESEMEEDESDGEGGGNGGRRVTFAGEAGGDSGVQRAADSLFAPSVAAAAAVVGSAAQGRKRKAGGGGSGGGRRGRGGRRGGARKTGKTAGKLLPASISALLGSAHRFYLEGSYAEAAPLLSEAIRLAPQVGILFAVQLRREIDKVAPPPPRAHRGPRP